MGSCGDLPAVLQSNNNYLTLQIKTITSCCRTNPDPRFPGLPCPLGQVPNLRGGGSWRRLLTHIRPLGSKYFLVILLADPTCGMSVIFS